MIVRMGAMPVFSSSTGLSTLKKTRTPAVSRWIGLMLMVWFLLMPVGLVFVPWQQTVRARGQMVAFAPTQRKQSITSRVSGRVGKWRVVEGSRVKAGEVLVDIDDNDPELATRLDAQKKFLVSRRQAAEEEVSEQAKAVEAQNRALDAAVRAARANREASAMLVDVAKQARANTDFSAVFEQRRYQMYEKLFLDKQFGGLESALNRDEAQMRADRAGTEVKRADAEIKRTEASLINSESLVLQAEATGLSTLATTRRDLRRAEQNLFSVERDLQEIDNRIERFKARYVTAPCDGIVFRISANVAEGGQFVKEGEDLAVLVPDTNDRVVELLIDGVDAPLIAAFMQERGEGPHVRLQFEGWPAIQFAGWPSVATGTFGGKVRQIDATDDGNGRFRVLVEPEELVEADRWPDAQFLRQGNQAVGWVFLNKVSLGYELWRNLNGFPPVVAPKSNDKYKEGGKPPKVKPL